MQSEGHHFPDALKKRSRYGSRMVIRLILAGTLLLSFSSSATEFWVATTGSDLNDGSLTKPFATFEHARDAARQLRNQKGSITIFIRGGDYIRTNALELTAADSGRPESPIIWRAYQKEPARLLGGRKLNGFRPVSDPAVLERLEERARTHVVQLRLHDIGINDFGEMKSRGFGRPSATAHYELFLDHHPMTLARWPNQGEFAKITGYPSTSDRRDEHGGNLGELPGGFQYDGDRPRRWRDISDLWVHGYWAYDWANSYEKVASLDVEQHLVKTAPPYGIYGFRQSQRFYFLNVLEELDEPGEWFLDRKSGILYFWPPADPNKVAENAHEILLSQLEQPLVRLTGVSNLTLQGLTFEATRGNAIEVRGGESNHIAGCLICNVGNNGVVIDGGFANGVMSCDIFDTGDGGVELTGGDRQTLKPGGHFVENCHFQRQGR
jgi:hypothetical protein